MGARQFRVAIIGLGMMGHYLAQACRAESNVALVAGCDVEEESRQRWGAAWGVDDSALYADYAAMLDRQQPDVVMVATHAPLHHEHVMTAIAHGIHVYCEKPLALSLHDADEMVSASATAGLKLGVNHMKRGSRGNAIITRLMADGTIGQPYLLRGEGKGGRWAGSELMEMGTHLFDWLRLLAGDPQWLFAHIVQNGQPAGRNDIVHSLALPYRERDCGLVLGERAFCALGLPSGVHADIGFLAQPDDRDNDRGYGFDICGTEGILAVRRGLGTDIFLQRGHHRGPLAAQPWEQIPVDEYADLTPPISGDMDERLACQRRLLADFLVAIEENRDPLSSGLDGLAALELSMAVWESQRLGQPVVLPLSERTHPLERWQANGA